MRKRSGRRPGEAMASGVARDAVRGSGGPANPEMDEGERLRLIERIDHADLAIKRVAIKQGDIGLFSSDLTIQQIRVLLILAAAGDESSHELASAIGVGPTTLTGIVDRLETRGLVSRKPDPGDRRVRLVALSDEGWRQVSELNETHREHSHRLLRRLEPRLLANLAEVVEALAALAAEEFLPAAEDGVTAPGEPWPDASAPGARTPRSGR